MTKIQVKPAQETVEKVKKVVSKKVKDVAKVVVDKAKDRVLAEGGKAVNKIKEKAVSEGKKVAAQGVDKLHAHAAKHLSNWHLKSSDKEAFAKFVAKHARTLLK